MALISLNLLEQCHRIRNRKKLSISFDYTSAVFVVIGARRHYHLNLKPAPTAKVNKRSMTWDWRLPSSSLHLWLGVPEPDMLANTLHRQFSPDAGPWEACAKHFFLFCDRVSNETLLVLHDLQLTLCFILFTIFSLPIIIFQMFRWICS